MKSSKALNDLRLEMVQLANKYSKEEFANRILFASMDVGVEFSEWISSKKSAKYLSSLSNPFVLETIKFLETLRGSHPDGMSKPDFMKYFVSTSNSKYLGVIISLAKVFKSNGSAILEPYSSIFSCTDMFSGIDQSDHALVVTTLSQIESAFREYTQTLINHPFGERDIADKKVRLTKDDKKRELFHFLIGQVNERIASSLENYGYVEQASAVRSDSMFMVNHEAITKNKLVVDKRNYSYLVIQAQDLAKTILKRIEPSDYEYNYNLMINTVMRHNMVMSDEDYDKYFYNLMLAKGRGSIDPPKRVDFNEKSWLNPNVIAFLFVTLTVLMSQVKF